MINPSAIRPAMVTDGQFLTHVGRITSGDVPDLGLRPLFKPGEIDFSRGLAVTSGGSHRLVVPINIDDPVPLVYPQGHPDAGQPIRGYDGSPIGGEGAVGYIFHNPTDGTLQAVPNGGVIIFNNMSTHEMDILGHRIMTYPTGVTTVSDVDDILRYGAQYAHAQDFYNSDMDYVKGAMTEVVTTWNDFDYVRNKDTFPAVYIPGEGAFQGPAGTPQLFHDGAVIIRRNGEERLIQPDAFLATHTQANGAPLRLDMLPRATFLPATGG